jgi:flagellar hook protein FlgE
MGDNGTLQDAAGNEVQGWMMTAIDSQNDVTSTNPNVNVFTNDFTKLLSSKVVRHGTYVETITAKATDYSTTAKSDSASSFSGDGAKTKSSKMSDIEAAIKDYTTWLQKLKDEPDAASSTSISQISQINFNSGQESIVSKDGDQIYAYINGNKYSQNFLLTNASQDFKVDLYSTLTVAERTAEGLVDPGTATSPIVLTDAQTAAYNKAAGKIATYKALADKLSQIPGLVATMAIDTGKADMFTLDTVYNSSTKNADMLKGIIQIKSLIPGSEFTISEIAEVSGSRVSQGNTQNTTLGLKGAGIGALETSKNALAELISGKQQDVYTAKDDLNLDGTTANIYNFGITIYDKELKINTPIPNDGGIPPKALPITITATKIDDIVTQINESELSSQIEARNVNGNLVIQTKDSNYDVEFTSNLQQLPTVRIDLNEVIDNADYSFNLMVNGTPTPFSLGAGIPDISESNTLTQTQIYDNIKTKIDTYNLTATDKLGISTLSTDGKFSIYTTDETVSFSGSTVGISGVDIPTSPSLVATSNPTVLDNSTFTLTPSTGGVETYTVTIMGQTVSYSTAAAVENEATIYAGISAAINANTTLAGFIADGTFSVKPLTGATFDITQNLYTTSSAGLAAAVTSTIPGNLSVASTYDPGAAATHTFTPVLGDNKSASVFTLNVEGIDLKVQTDQTPNVAELNTLLNAALALPANADLASKITITTNGTDIIITEKIGSQGFVGIPGSSSLTATSFTAAGNEIKTVVSVTSEASPIDVNANYSGRKGAGAEFIEIVNKVDQTASKGSLQLRLDTLGISDSAFGEFSVDSTGLITMKQDGAEFAVGQVAIAVFNNNRGLNPSGDNLLSKTNESGDPTYNLNNNKTAKIESKTLELSTADLSESLVNLMVFQRAFEANAKSITTADELLNTLINLKR